MATDPNKALIATTQGYSNGFPATTIGALSAQVTALDGEMTTAQADIIDVESAAITDPGDAGAIPANANGVCEIVTLAAETRTLAAPARLGILLTIIMHTDGGNCVITAASAINQAANNTITLAEVRDCIVLQSSKVGGALAWRVLSNDGAALSTV